MNRDEELMQCFKEMRAVMRKWHVTTEEMTRLLAIAFGRTGWTTEIPYGMKPGPSETKAENKEQ